MAGTKCYYQCLHWPLQRGKRPPRYDHPQYTSSVAYAISHDGDPLGETQSGTSSKGPAETIDRHEDLAASGPADQGESSDAK